MNNLKNNKKSILIISVLIISVLVLIFFSVFKNKQDQINSKYNLQAPNITNTPLSPIQPIYKITDVVPADKDKSISPDANIIITFDSVPDPETIEFSIMPDEEVQTQVSGNILTVNPVADLLPGTEYTFIVKYTNSLLPSRTYSFITAGPFKGFPDTQPQDAAKQQEDFDRNTKPDIFLTNKLPYNAASFQTESEYVPGNPGHFRFKVIQKSSSGKTEFLNWLKSLELTEDQISKLDIVYN